MAAGTVVSQTRFAPLMTLFAAAAIGALFYAEVLWGGGLSSAVGVTAYLANYGSDLASRLKASQDAVKAMNSATPAATASPAAGSVSPQPQDQVQPGSGRIAGSSTRRES